MAFSKEPGQEDCQDGIARCLACPDAVACPQVAELNRRLNHEARMARSGGKPEVVHPRNTLNELSGERWLYFTKSVLTTSYPEEYGLKLRRAHGANKPPRLMQQLIEFFTKPGQLVLDPFAGVGGTLIGAAICARPRRALGIEINHRWIDVYHEVLGQYPELAPFPVIEGDCRLVLAEYPAGHFDFIATDPPYNTHFKRTMCDGKYNETHANRRSDYDMRSEHTGDLANLGSYDEYLGAMEAFLAECYRTLKPGRYLVLIVRDAYQKGQYIFTHSDLAARAGKQGFLAKGEIIWYQAGARLRPYGYPYAFVPNITHQHILVLRKELPQGKNKRVGASTPGLAKSDF